MKASYNLIAILFSLILSNFTPLKSQILEDNATQKLANEVLQKIYSLDFLARKL